jgi:hypothetical protein
VRTLAIDGESAIPVGELVLVAAKSEPGTWYAVEAGRCSCKGFTYRGACRHLAIAVEARMLAGFATDCTPLAPTRPVEDAPLAHGPRGLTDTEIIAFGQQPGAKSIAVENFLSTLDLTFPLFAHRRNMNADAREYGWNTGTIRAITAGLALAYSEVQS